MRSATRATAPATRWAGRRKFLTTVGAVDTAKPLTRTRPFDGFDASGTPDGIHPLAIEAASGWKPSSTTPAEQSCCWALAPVVTARVRGWRGAHTGHRHATRRWPGTGFSAITEANLLSVTEATDAHPGHDGTYTSHYEIAWKDRWSP